MECQHAAVAVKTLTDIVWVTAHKISANNTPQSPESHHSFNLSLSDLILGEGKSN